MGSPLTRSEQQWHHNQLLLAPPPPFQAYDTQEHWQPRSNAVLTLLSSQHLGMEDAIPECQL